jgi:hypothetical protein
MTPVYWKPRYPTRHMRERAFAKRELAREQAVRRSAPGPGPSWLGRLRSWLRR